MKPFPVAIKRDSHASRARRIGARLLADLGLHGLAGDVYQHDWKRGRRTASLAQAIANARLHAGENAEAVVFFREACRLEPARVEARAGLVCSLFREGAIRESAREALTLSTLVPCAELWVLIAELRKRTGDTIGSIEAFRLAARAEAAAARFVLGEALLGDNVWSGLIAPLGSVQRARQAVGVGTHLVRNRSSLFSRAMATRRAAALFAAGLVLSSAPATAQTAPPSGEPTPSPAPVVEHHAHPEAIKALPSAGSLTGRAVQLNAGLVLEREEGAGLFPAEPSRFVFRGGSWTQSRVEIDGFDVTDPLFGGRAVAFGSVDIGDVLVRTDSKGTVLSHDHPWRVAAPGTRVLIQGNLGLFDSSGTATAPIPSLARGHHLFDGVIAAEGLSQGGAHWSAAVSGADVSRSERASDLERATQRLGFEGRFSQARGEDLVQGHALYQGRRAPFRLTIGETRAQGLVTGIHWMRRDPRALFGRLSYLRGSSQDPKEGSPALFERLVDGTPAQQVPYESVANRLQAEGGRRFSFGSSTSVSLTARFGRASAERALSQNPFQALERLNGTSAREWTVTSNSPSRLLETRLALSVGIGRTLSERTRVDGAVEVRRVSVSDRDGESLLSVTKLLPELRFEWRKNERTELYAEASIGAPNVPLASYEAATRHAPLVVARLWRDANGDGRLTSSERGIEVARRGPGSVTADPALTLPQMRRVAVGFKTKVGGLGIHATAYARRDTDLIETALNPQGSEIARTRNLADPSGDIVGPSDDQILPVVEESARAFSSSAFLLTNPQEHRALGEGAQLGFETNTRHVHWGLNGAAFRDSGRGGNRGLRVEENDFGVVGESFDRTNADTYGYGRLFFDRAYSLKMFLTANDVRGFTLGAVGRYDDGQPFARLVIQNDLPQGPDFVQAIARGRARLHYTLSVDARLARRFKVGRADVEMSASVFNALGSAFEAEEQVVWLPDYRRITMVQPPRSFVLGVRIER